MIIIGSGGFAKQLLHAVNGSMLNGLAFYDDYNVSKKLFLEKFPVLNSEYEVAEYFRENDKSFALGVGGPQNRRNLASKFEKLNGVLTSIISANADISGYGVTIGPGANILSGVIIEPCVTIGKGVIINVNSAVTHDSYVGDFVEVGPNVNLLGGCYIGTGTFVGSGAIILPKIKVGDNVIIGAGAVVVKNVRDGETIKGVPAK